MVVVPAEEDVVPGFDGSTKVVVVEEPLSPGCWASPATDGTVVVIPKEPPA